MSRYEYIKDGMAIYERSFAIIRAETRLECFAADEAELAVRMVHACGLVEAAEHFVFSPGFVDAARAALTGGAPILCDTEMVARGVTRSRLPADNQVVCTIGDAEVAGLAAEIGNTRSAAALHLWGDRLGGRGCRHRQCAIGAVSICWKCSTTARRVRQQSSACRWDLSGRRNPRRRWRLMMPAFPSPSCAGGSAAAP